MSLRLCSYNIEWFNHLFNKDNTMKESEDEQDRLKALGRVLRHIDADIIGITEAPNTTVDRTQSTITKLETFAAFAELETSKALTGIISPGTQEIALLYNPDKVTAVHAPGGQKDLKRNPSFDGEFIFDTDEDRIKELYKHYRPPLEAEITVNATGAKFKLMVCHTKSKGIFSSMDMLHWERENRRNRLKLFAEATWIRRRVDEWLDGDSEIVLMGDINDGPGMDYYEMKFGRSAVEIIMGDIFEPERILKNPAGRPKWGYFGWKPSTVRFEDRITETPINALIDHVMTTQSLPLVDGNPHNIWNPYENEIAEPIKWDLKTASDHFPITLDVDL